MDFFTALNIFSSGLGAERVRLNVTASNLANANTTRGADGRAYRRRDPVFQLVELEGRDPFEDQLRDAVASVEVSEVVTDRDPPRTIYDPAHPDANADGYVELPNVNMIEEMVNMITAARAYEANVTAMRTLVDMARKTLER